MKQKKVKDIMVFNTRGKELAPTSIDVAKVLVAREKAVWIQENKSLTLLYMKREFKQLKKKIIKEENRVCYICGYVIPSSEIATIDHVNPKSKYGKDSRNNLRCCCQRCNEDKRNMDIFQYIRHIKKNLEKYDYIDLNNLEKEVLKYKM